MAQFPPTTWLVLIAIGAGAVLAILNVLARIVQQERDLHDLRTRVVEVRQAYSRRLAELEARERGGSVGIAEAIELPVEPAEARQAA